MKTPHNPLVDNLFGSTLVDIFRGEGRQGYCPQLKICNDYALKSDKKVA